MVIGAIFIEVYLILLQLIHRQHTLLSGLRY